jgi:chaperonin GroES
MDRVEDRDAGHRAVWRGAEARRIIYQVVLLYFTQRETRMPADATPRRTKLETVEPLGKRVLIRKDEDKKQTKGGIALPDNIEIPTLTGRVVSVSQQVQNDDDFPILQYDKVLFNPKNSIPVDLEPGNQLFVVPIDDVVAIFRAAE